MGTFKIGICEPYGFSQKSLFLLSEIGEISFFSGTDLKEFIADKDIIFVRLKYEISDDLLSTAKNLKYICSPTTGLNHIKISNSSCKIVSLKGDYTFLETIRATPEHIFGLSLALLRNYSLAFLNSKNTVFNRDLYKGFELYQNKIGIIGLGRVGVLLARYFTAFDADVYFYDIEDKQHESAKKCDSLSELIEKTNVIILSANYTQSNKCMLSYEHFSLMKDKYFINAARGELVDETALLQFIKEDWFKGVAIDVLSDETRSSLFLDELLKISDYKNVIITPHIGGATFSSMERTEEHITLKLLEQLHTGG